MRQERKYVLRLDDLGRALERRFGVADHSACRGRPAAGGWDACDESCFACAAYPTLLCVATGPSSHVTFSVRRALLACHQLSATIATPEASELAPRPRRVDDERVLDARQPLHLVEVGADRLAAEHRTLLEHREQRARRLDVDAE